MKLAGLLVIMILSAILMSFNFFLFLGFVGIVVIVKVREKR